MTVYAICVKTNPHLDNNNGHKLAIEKPAPVDHKLKPYVWDLIFSKV